MKKIHALLLLVCCAATCLAQEKVAVYVAGDVDQTVKSLIESKAATRISQSKEYVAVERTAEFLQVLTKEQDYQLSGEVPESQITELGQRFGVRYVAVLRVSLVGKEGMIMAKLIDVENGTVIKAVDTNREVQSVADWGTIANNAAYRLFTVKSK